MILAKKARIAAIVLTLASPALLGAFVPSKAGTPSTTPLIDKDFEVAVSKFASKRFFNRIDASPEQREKLAKIIGDTQNDTRPLREELREKALNLSNLMVDDKVTDKEIKEKVKELRALHEQVQDSRLAAILEARKVLSADQRQKIHAKIVERISGGLRPKTIGLLLQTAGDRVMDD